MSKTLATIAMCAACWLVPTVGAQAGVPIRIALLPPKQVRMPGISQVSDEALAAALHVVFSEMSDFELVEFSTLREQFEDQLVEEALFEVVVTDDLKHALQAMEVFDAHVGNVARYREPARRLGIGYLAEITFEGRRDATQVNYCLTDTQTGRITLAKSFSYIPSESARIARETARRLGHDLWRLSPTADGLHGKGQ